ncbi:N,N-dimethylformamidase beta subunit family domain-containing protein [Streptosporangium sp. NBC_01469]|uniref:N,N-dimethylformamidase beta subunit family domain-containing protein n=1 Tax=Streptosporangium sp. NBC_01469 TaxID=2903898 RepID=UPI002E2DBF05|nr:N,N-dimethylformamidase beta subunit family domain-containing protein [Streptosporangium sp. NBC_01469]
MTLAVRAYAARTSVPQGGSLRFRLATDDLMTDPTDPTDPTDDPAAGDPVADGERGAVGCRARVRDAVTGEVRAELDASGPWWTLDVPGGWPSSLYAVAFTSDIPGTPDGPDSPDGPDEETYFVVRPREPRTGGAILVSVPFLTWQAYNGAGVPGEGLYPTESPERAGRVTFDRPGGGPAGNWEDHFYRWLSRSGIRADYCSNLDLHEDPDTLLRDRRLLVIPGHDEYWTRRMRDAAESFVAAGGNIAFFGGNTCWWQVRLEDDGRTMVCHRDALLDPMAAIDPSLVTVEWSGSPVCRPENSLTGVSFRRGAGCWEDMDAMKSEAYTVRFAEHWVFEGTGLRDGDTFGRGAVGYETDAAEYAEVDGVPLATGADGTPADFAILATADLRHWRHLGQGGHATMGIMRRGAGTVFNAATIGWGDALDDPVVDRVTRNVLARLAGAPGWWEPMGGGAAALALAACERQLFAAGADGDLWVRPYRTQNLRWRRIEPAPGLVALTAPREATPGSPVLLYGLHADGRVVAREPVTGRAPWRDLYDAPPGAVGIAPVDQTMFAAGADGELWWRPLAAGRSGPWTRAGDAGPALVALAHVGGRLIGLTRDGELRVRTPGGDGWTPWGATPGLVTLTGTAGRLVGATPGGDLFWRELVHGGTTGHPQTGNEE